MEGKKLSLFFLSLSLSLCCIADFIAMHSSIQEGADIFAFFLSASLLITAPESQINIWSLVTERIACSVMLLKYCRLKFTVLESFPELIANSAGIILH